MYWRVYSTDLGSYEVRVRVREIKVRKESVTNEKRMMVLLLTAAMGMTMMGCQYGGDADAKSEQEETKKRRHAIAHHS